MKPSFHCENGANASFGFQTPPSVWINGYTAYVPYVYFFCLFLLALFYLEADSENESVKESPQIISVTVEQTEEHVFAK